MIPIDTKQQFNLARKTVRRWYASRLSVILESIVIGFAGGAVVVGFRFALSRADFIRRLIYQTLADRAWYWTVSWALCLCALGLFLGWCAKTFPMIKGSGIPQIKGVLARQMVFSWKSELPIKILTGLLGIGVGLSLGREGPSIQIAVYVGLGVLHLLKRPYADRKFLVTAASAAGLSAAFSAPLAGVLFVLEELQGGFSPLLIACAMGASMAADAVAGLFFGFSPVFDFRKIDPTPLVDFPWIVVLGIACAFFGDVFKRSLYLAQDFFQKLRIPQLLRPILPLIATIPLGFYLFEATGGGHELIKTLSEEGLPLRLLVALLLVKTAFTALCYGSGTAGGIFLPLLACGAILGDIIGQVLSLFGLIEAGHNLNFIILGMAAFFSAVAEAPVTGVVLILEMSGNFNHFGGLVLVCLSAFVTSEVIGSRPVYSVLLERMLAQGSPKPKRAKRERGPSE